MFAQAMKIGGKLERRRRYAEACAAYKKAFHAFPMGKLSKASKVCVSMHVS